MQPEATRVFLGIFCRAAQYEHRQLVRATMLGIAGPDSVSAFSPVAGLSVVHRFVVCGTGAASQTVKNTATDSRDVGIGALAYLLAPEMTASLAANFAPT